MPLTARAGHALHRLPLSHYWWLLLGRHSLRHVHSYLRLHKGLRLPLPWPKQECLHLHHKPYKFLLRYPCLTRQPHLLQGWPADSSLCE
uniref:Uncharacterized protein n=1 Tax=Human betaherpesvirus 6 TaxID=10368 RepID=A0A1W6GAS1_9BETA|nr:hypothetical protein [Human betaherpesvirus 6]QFX62269.1 hypothetical protein [Human betaherpesvirus 6]